MTTEQQSALVEAARAAVDWLKKEAHRTTCAYVPASLFAEWHRKPTPPESLCTCGLWQTREALRRALEGADGSVSAEGTEGNGGV